MNDRHSVVLGGQQAAPRLLQRLLHERGRPGGGVYKAGIPADLVEHGLYIGEHGEDLPEIRNWKWGDPA